MNDYEKLKSIIDEIDILILHQVSASTPEFKAWKSQAERFLIRHFGDKSFEVNDFRRYTFSLGIYTLGTPQSDFIHACKRDLLKVKAVFQTYLDELQEEETEHTQNHSQLNYSKIFIVHGHDGELKESVARLVEKQGIEAIILSEQANRGATIIEKIENNSDVGAAICLFTTDDTGKSNTETDYHSRARQNVVFEAGYFMGKLGRENVVMISDPDIEIPSDLSGVVYSNKNFWQVEVLKELSEMGFTIDLNKLL